MEALRCWGRALLDFAYPPHCAVCEAEIAAAEMLCPPCWAEALGLPVYAGALQRCKKTRQQALLPAVERRDNLRGAFASGSWKMCGQRARR